MDMDGRLRYLNGAAEGLLAVSASRAVGHIAEQFLGMGAVLQGAIESAEAGHTTRFREIEIRKRSFPQESDGCMTIDCMVSPFAVDVEMPWAVVETVTVEPLARDTEWREHKVAT